MGCCCNCFRKKKKQPDPCVTSRRNNDPMREPLIGPDADGRSLEYCILDSKHLDSRGDCDFTNVVDGGSKHMRGGYPYNRPYGWKKVGLRVKDKYDNDKWLVNNNKGKGEWAITYHGTGKECFNPICEEGYKIGPRDAYGKGIYSSPKIDVAAGYSRLFTYQGEEYQGVFQNRVKQTGANKVESGIIWVCSNPEDIRPYALCIKKCNK